MDSTVILTGFGLIIAFVAGFRLDILLTKREASKVDLETSKMRLENEQRKAEFHNLMEETAAQFTDMAEEMADAVKDGLPDEDIPQKSDKERVH